MNINVKNVIIILNFSQKTAKKNLKNARSVEAKGPKNSFRHSVQLFMAAEAVLTHHVQRGPAPRERVRSSVA